MNKISGWGRCPKYDVNEVFPDSEKDLLNILSKNPNSFIARGNGRSYGDSSINKELTISMTKMNKFLSWDSTNGILVAEAGALISDIIEFLMPQGWFPTVSPGTKYITLGGAIASDIHGKNHHLEGSFGRHVNWIEIVNDQNKIIRCSPNENVNIFNWTIGGMGLTGVITKCSIKLRKIETGWISQKVIANDNLENTLNSFYENNHYLYSVAWIDCLSDKKKFGRSILILGDHVKKNKLLKTQEIFPKIKKQLISFPFEMPSFFLNNFFVSIFNNIYYHLNKRKKTSLISWDNYFYPLDSIKNWNKMYGRNGFFQFQCVIPLESSKEAYTKMLRLIQKESSGSFLAVLKKFGSGNEYFSFPEDGFTLALDFKNSDRNIKTASKLSKIVSEYNGSIYLAKDSLLQSIEFKNIYGKNKISEFQQFKNIHCSSMQSQRLGL